MLSIREDLWYVDWVDAQSVLEFPLVLLAHEHILLLEAHHVSLQDVLHSLALLVGSPDDAHARCVHDDLTLLLYSEVLENMSIDFSIFFNILRGDMSPFSGTIGTPILDFGRLYPWVLKLFCEATGTLCWALDDSGYGF